MKLDGNIMVLTQWSFKDALVQTYTLPYVAIIRKIISADRKILIVTAEQTHIALNKRETEAINTEWSTVNMQLLALPYRRFGLKKIIASSTQFFKLYRLIKKEKVKVIHAFCTPAGSIAYLLCKITGTKLVIDSYEPHAEAMVENGSWKKTSLAYKILFALEKKQSKRASFIISAAEGMKQYAKEKYGIEIRSHFIKPACVNLQQFFPHEKNETLLKELGLDNKIVCVYAGKLGGIYLKDEVFNFIKTCSDYWKNNFRFLMLTNATREEINSEIKRAGIPDDVVISKFVSHHQIPEYLSLGDFAINPVKPVPTKRYCTSIKDGEYWAMGLPVIISPNISEDSAIIEKEKTGVVLDFSNPVEINSAIGKIEELLKGQAGLKNKIRSIAEKFRSFDIAENIYKEIYS
jgi:glycosyltransferase involved in cell wall biosynthesis